MSKCSELYVGYRRKRRRDRTERIEREDRHMLYTCKYINYIEETKLELSRWPVGSEVNRSMHLYCIYWNSVLSGCNPTMFIGLPGKQLFNLM